VLAEETFSTEQDAALFLRFPPAKKELRPLVYGF
jgi:hypothetical protein